jgi:excisionase family DNA binding protein
MNIPADPIAFTIRNAAAVAGVGRTTIYRLIADGVLDARKCRGRTLILASELRRYLENLPPSVHGGGDARAA